MVRQQQHSSAKGLLTFICGPLYYSRHHTLTNIITFSSNLSTTYKQGVQETKKAILYCQSSIENPNHKERSELEEVENAKGSKLPFFKKDGSFPAIFILAPP